MAMGYPRQDDCPKWRRKNYRLRRIYKARGIELEEARYGPTKNKEAAFVAFRRYVRIQKKLREFRGWEK